MPTTEYFFACHEKNKQTGALKNHVNLAGRRLHDDVTMLMH
jgi:hypothetical protein